MLYNGANEQYFALSINNFLKESIRICLSMRVQDTEVVSFRSLWIGEDGLMKRWDLCWISPLFLQNNGVNEIPGQDGMTRSGRG